MKIVIQKRELENVLVKSIPFLESKDMSMITSNVLITLNDGIMTIDATNYELGLSSTIQCMGIINDGSVIVNGKKLLEIIKILKNDNVTIESIKDNLHITQLRSKFKVSLFNGGEFPKFPNVDNDVNISINPSDLIESFRLITPTIDMNNPKYEFNGALVDIKSDGIDFVSTDIKRMSIVSIENKNDNELSIIIPRIAITEIQKLFFEDIKIYCNDTYFIIKAHNFFFFTKLINGKYPDVKRVIPTELIHEITVNKLEMIENIKQINVVSSEVQISISNNKIVFNSLHDTNNDAVTDMDIDFAIDKNIVFAFNSKYVLDFLNVIYDDTFVLGINEADLPFVLQSCELKTIIMPVVL